MPDRRHLLAWLAGLAAAPLTARSAADEATPRPWAPGRATPPLELPLYGDPGGARWSLAQARGRPVVLNFWATWCEPCRSEMPSLELLAQRHEADGLDVVAVNYRETDVAIKRYLAQWPITLPILRDAEGGAARAFGVRIFPTTIAIGRDGRAAFSVVGEADWTSAESRRWIAPLLR